MKVTDSRDLGGPGILPLQDHEKTKLLAGKHLILATRKVGRQSSEGQLGHLETEPGTTGDLIRGFLWTAGGREFPAWGFVFGATSTEVQVSAGGTGEQVDRLTGTFRAKPIRKGWDVDERFDHLQFERRKFWPYIPKGWSGLAVAGTDESEQSVQFHPTDPRIPLVHTGVFPRAGAVVCDLDEDGKPDVDRHARLHGALRVIRKPGNAPMNVVALTLGASGKGDTRGGYVFDRTPNARALTRPERPRATTPGDGRSHLLPEGHPALGPQQLSQTNPLSALTLGGIGQGGIVGGGAIARNEETAGDKIGDVVAMLSQNDGGPIDVGGTNDPHRITRDQDGNPINPAHISTAALFRNRDRPAEDGPLRFDEVYREGDDATFVTKVYLAWTGSDFAWWGSSFVYKLDEAVPGDPPPTITPRYPPREPRGPREPIYPHTGLVSTAFAFRGGVGVVQEFSAPAFVARPQRIRTGLADLRYAAHPKHDDVATHERTAPVTGRLEAFGAQGGPSPYLSQSQPWVYTQEPGRSRSPGGTASGGLIFLPPEADMADIDRDFDPGTVSAALFVMGPGTKLAFGKPDLSDGAMRDGWTVDEDGSGNLTVALWGTGVEGEAYKFPVAIGKTFTFPDDATGTLPHLQVDSTTGVMSFVGTQAAAIADLAAPGSMGGSDQINQTALENYLSDIRTKLNSLLAASRSYEIIDT